jgi:hypothetical protein
MEGSEMANYARHDRVLEAAARKGGWKNSISSGGGYGSLSSDLYMDDKAAESYFSGKGREGRSLSVIFNAGGYVVGVEICVGVSGKVLATTGDLKDRKAKERLAIAEKFILDHPKEEK